MKLRGQGEAGVRSRRARGLTQVDRLRLPTRPVRSLPCTSRSPRRSTFPGSRPVPACGAVTSTVGLAGPVVVSQARTERDRSMVQDVDRGLEPQEQQGEPSLWRAGMDQWDCEGSRRDADCQWRRGSERVAGTLWGTANAFVGAEEWWATAVLCTRGVHGELRDGGRRTSLSKSCRDAPRRLRARGLSGFVAGRLMLSK